MWTCQGKVQDSAWYSEIIVEKDLLWLTWFQPFNSLEYLKKGFGTDKKFLFLYADVKLCILELCIVFFIQNDSESLGHDQSVHFYDYNGDHHASFGIF